jgi:hypothetical protein
MRKRSPTASSVPGRRIGVHDRHQFELKLEYTPPPGRSESRYTVETYLFAPASLNLDAETVPPQVLYRDIHNYVRLKTPDMTWGELIERDDSPLQALGPALEGMIAGAGPGELTYECKLFACIVRGALRDFASATAAELRGRSPDLERVRELIDGALAGSAQVVAAYRRFDDRVDRIGVPGEARIPYRLADEYVSISIEQLLRRAIVDLDRCRHLSERDTRELKERLFERILSEERHRRQQGYPSIIDPESDNEPYIFRAGLLKKFCSSALFLRIHRQAARKTWQELFFAIAAGIAMAFATIMAFWAQATYGAIGLRVFVILVVAYMFKDRIKEGTRALFARFLERTMYDRKIVIDDPAGGKLGTCLEKIEYLARRAVPEEVMRARQLDEDSTTRAAEAELQESVIRYRKEIVIGSAGVAAARA